MQIRIVGALILLALHSNTFACDVCGGVSSPMTNGLLTTNQFHIVGLHYTGDWYQSTNFDVFTSSSRHTKEWMNRLDVFGRYQFARKWNIEALIPLAMNHYSDNTVNKTISGLGDILIKTNYNLLDRRDSTRQHLLTLGAGVKFPSGLYVNHNDTLFNLYPGTGSIDILLSTNYRLNNKNMGLVMAYTYILKTKNRFGYKYGDLHHFDALLYYKWSNKKSLNLYPLIGCNYQYTLTDQYNNSDVSHGFNSGHLVKAYVGLNTSVKNVLIQLKGGLPIFQNISNGDTRSTGFVEAGVNYLIPKKNKS